MPMRESARGHASSRRLPRSQTSRFSLFPPDPSPRLCQYCRPHPFFLHPEAIQDRLFSVFRFCGRRSFLANAKASLSCPDRTVCFARISRSINLLRRDQFSESCRLRPCFFTILSEARSRHCRFSIIFSPSLSAIFCDAQIALVITHFCRKGTVDRPSIIGIATIVTTNQTLEQIFSAMCSLTCVSLIGLQLLLYRRKGLRLDNRWNRDRNPFLRRNLVQRIRAARLKASSTPCT